MTNQNDNKILWSNNEVLIQSYRSCFISSQSLLIAAGSMFFEKSPTIFSVICGVALFQMWYIWFRVIRARTITNDFYKHDLNIYVDETGKALSSSADKKPLTEALYRRNYRIRKEANRTIAEITKNPKLKRNFRLTRIKVDILMPVSFTLIWIVIAVFVWL